MIREIKSVILAAGKGSRMESNLPKVLHKVGGKPMINHILETFQQIENITQNILVLGYKKEDILKSVGQDTPFVVQDQQLGTGHAVQMAKEKLAGFNGDVFIAYGDCPLLSKETIQKLISEHQENNVVCTVLTAHLDNPSGYGRIVKRGEYVTAIVEELDASPEVKDIKEVNSGVYVVNSKMLFKALDAINNNNAKQEYYLTDIVKYFVDNGLKVHSYMTPNIVEIQGVNTLQQLAYVESILKMR